MRTGVRESFASRNRSCGHYCCWEWEQWGLECTYQRYALPTVSRAMISIWLRNRVWVGITSKVIGLQIPNSDNAYGTGYAGTVAY